VRLKNFKELIEISKIKFKNSKKNGLIVNQEIE